ncbi:hypothetical protein [Rhizobium leguminosarum]|uniref:hypothetical protein n=1 Tax=Rhizobium leguminosarum TaxID=384 RepID=UPI002E13BA50|nr:hypothetical protein U8Q02_40270 [Rhizobium leguminosarum]
MTERLSYTSQSLLQATNLAIEAVGFEREGEGKLAVTALTAPAAVFSGAATLRGGDAARVAKAAHDIFLTGGLDFASEHEAALDEEAFAERRRTIGTAMLHNAQLLGERLFDGFNTARGIRILSRGRVDARVLRDGDIEVIIPFTYDDDAPAAARANFVARFDAVTLAIIEASALDSGNDRFGFVSSAVLDEITKHSRGGLATGYRMELEASASNPLRPRVLSDEERAAIIGGWVADYATTATGVTNVQTSDLAVVERHDDGSFRMEASACYDKDDDRVRAKLVLHVATNPFYLDAVVVDDSDHAVAWLDMYGREQAYDAAGFMLDEQWAEDYEMRRGENPLQKHLDQSEFGP